MAPLASIGCRPPGLVQLAILSGSPAGPEKSASCSCTSSALKRVRVMTKRYRSLATSSMGSGGAGGGGMRSCGCGSPPQRTTVAKHGASVTGRYELFLGLVNRRNCDLPPGTEFLDEKLARKREGAEGN